MDIVKNAGATPDRARFERLREDAFATIDAGRNNAYRAINTVMVYSYYELGRRIVEEEQFVWTSDLSGAFGLRGACMRL